MQMATNRYRIFLFLFASVLAFSPTLSFATPFSCNPTQFNGIMELCVIASTAMFALIALTYIGGEAFQSARMLTWAKTEVIQAIASVAIASVVLFAMFSMCSFQVGELQSVFGLSSMPAIYAANSGADTLYNGAMRYVENLAAVSLSNVNSLRYDLGAYEIRTSYNTFACRGICIFSLASTSISTFGGESMNMAITNNLMGIGTIAYLSSIFQYFTLIYIYSGLFLIFLPLAIVLRSVPFMRHFGGSLVAIFVALYIMYPFMLVVDAYVVPGFVSDNSVVMCSRDGRNCDGSEVFSTASSQGIECSIPPAPGGTSVCGGYNEWQMEQVASWGVGGIGEGELEGGRGVKAMKSLSPNTLARAIHLNILIFLADVFLPALNFIVIAAFGRELSRFLGEEADLSRLGQMI